MIVTVGVISILIISSIFDVKRKRIPVVVLVIGGVASLIPFVLTGINRGWGNALGEAGCFCSLLLQ